MLTDVNRTARSGRRGRVIARGFAGALIALISLGAASGPATATDRPLERKHKGVTLMALPADPDRQFDTTLLPAAEGMDNIARALDHLLARSPASAQALATLRKHGRVVLAYIPDDLRNSSGNGETIAQYVPEHRRNPGLHGRKKTFRVLVGRHGVKWPKAELASVLAHELLGHGLQDHRGRLTTNRVLDLECEAYLYEEIANQDLDLDKFSREMIAFRQGLEQHWCSEFKAYMRKHRPGEVALWDELNPDVPALLKAFEAYTAHLGQEGIAGRALAADKRQFREKVGRALQDATPDELYQAAVILRDGGMGVKHDPPVAFRYFREAAEKGHADAMLNIARMYQKGIGVERDADAAIEWYRQAAEQGSAPAQTYIGWLSLKGRGVATDLDAAFAWFSKAAAKGDAQASYYLGTMHRLGLGRDEDHAAAAVWFRKAAEAGHTDSQYRLGWYLYRGIGVEKDQGEAAGWVRRAADNGHARSQNSLGWMYTKGNGVAQDPDIAARWFAKAAEQGFTDAQVRLGWLHVKGIGVEKDFASAYVWYALAAAEGHEKAVRSRDLIAGRLSPDALDEAKRRVKEFSGKENS